MRYSKSPLFFLAFVFAAFLTQISLAQADGSVAADGGLTLEQMIAQLLTNDSAENQSFINSLGEDLPAECPVESPLFSIDF